MAADAANGRVLERSDQFRNRIWREHDVGVREDDVVGVGGLDQRVHAVRLAVALSAEDDVDLVSERAEHLGCPIAGRIHVDQQFEVGHGMTHRKQVLNLGANDPLFIIGAYAQGDTVPQPGFPLQRPWPQPGESCQARRIRREWMQPECHERGSHGEERRTHCRDVS